MKEFNYLIALSLILVMSACSGEDAEKAEGEEELVKSVNVVTQDLTPGTFTSFVRVIGTVETSNDIMISAEVNGRVMSYAVSEGEEVRKGQTIIKIDDAKLKQEKARLEALTSQAKENYERLKRVYEEDGVGSEIEYLNAKYNYEQTKSSLESIKVDLANTNIKAPFTGTLESKMVEVGEMVSAGTPVVRLIGSDDYIVSAGVPARYADVVQTGDQLKVWFDTQEIDTLNATIAYTGSSINPQNRTFRIEVALPPKAKQYKVDMIANLRLNTLKRDSVLFISEEYIYSTRNGYVVYVLGENESGDAVAKERMVTLGPSYKTDVIIEEGLSSGDKLITIGSAFLDEGMRVTVKESPNTEIAVN
ncbi:efflux RND transporter periplasmic adaptor subunit [Gracilimonas sp.]|uniref:efflux RND transporter periplasmic adaptor subunit n=1 Tax=Gracilimonas sp. TaxID=1974203 RepID=UPI0032EECBDA